MSAADWRQAMNSGAGRRAMSAARPPVALRAAGTATPSLAEDTDTNAPRWLRFLWRHVRARHIVLLVALVAYPLFATPFFTFQIGGQALALGIIALSLSFLAGYGGMISLAQMTVAGIAGYLVAILGTSASEAISLNWPWYVAVPVAVLVATVIGTLIGWLSVRTEGIYTIMITLAIGVAFHYLALQNYSVLNGFQGHQRVYPPNVLGIDWRAPVPFFYLSLFFAMTSYFLVKYIVRTPFGIALQGIRDNPRRMNALGFHVTAHRVAAYALAGLIAAIGGVLFTWYNGLITPGSVGTSWLINVLVIAVLGGMKHPIGAFLGAIVFVLLQNFAIDVFDRERFNLVIGIAFLAIVLFSPDGLLGLWARIAGRFNAARAPQAALTPAPLPQAGEGRQQR
jgi:branched-chain amino acid transport system permease protein